MNSFTQPHMTNSSNLDDVIFTSPVKLRNILADWLAILPRIIYPISLVAIIFAVPYILFQAILPYETIFLKYGTWGNRIVKIINDLVGYFFAISSSICIGYIVENAEFNRFFTTISIVQFFFTRLIDVIYTNIQAAVVIIGGFFMLVVPGIMYTVSYSFVTTISALRYQRGKKALDASEKLIEGYWWKVLLYSIIIDGIGLFLSILLWLPVTTTVFLQGLKYVITTFILFVYTSLTFSIKVILFLKIEHIKAKKLELQNTQLLRNESYSDRIETSQTT